jgi:hypothetical protein
VPPATSPRPAFVPFVAPSNNKTTTTTKPKNNKSTNNAPAGTVAPAGNATAPAADPGSPPGTDPPIVVGGVVVTHNNKSAAERALEKKGLSTSGSGTGNVLLIGAVAVLPIIGAIALGGFGDTRRRFRRLAGHKYYG